jgi:hypothetical protein
MLEFEIIQVLDLKERGQYIFARQVQPEQDFTVRPGTYLGSIELDEYLEMPRALDDKCFQQNDLFTFKSKHQINKFDFAEGTVVQLNVSK